MDGVRILSRKGIWKKDNMVWARSPQSDECSGWFQTLRCSRRGGKLWHKGQNESKWQKRVESFTPRRRRRRRPSIPQHLKFSLYLLNGHLSFSAGPTSVCAQLRYLGAARPRRDPSGVYAARGFWKPVARPSGAGRSHSVCMCAPVKVHTHRLNGLAEVGPSQRERPSRLALTKIHWQSPGRRRQGPAGCSAALFGFFFKSRTCSNSARWSPKRTRRVTEITTSIKHVEPSVDLEAWEAVDYWGVLGRGGADYGWEVTVEVQMAMEGWMDGCQHKFISDWK